MPATAAPGDTEEVPRPPLVSGRSRVPKRG